MMFLDWNMVCWNICQVPGEDGDEDQGGLNFGVQRSGAARNQKHSENNSNTDGHPIINIEYLHNRYIIDI